MKKIIILLLVIVLSGCSFAQSFIINIDIENELERVFSKEDNKILRPNNYTELIEFYVPGDVNEEDSKELSYVFNVDDNKFIMNVNVAGVLNRDNGNSEVINEGFFDEDKLIYRRNGQLTNYDSEMVNYLFSAYIYDEQYILYFVTNEVSFYSLCKKDSVGLVTEKMLQMAKGCNANDEKIIDEFSSKVAIDYVKKTTSLFEKTYPESGRVEEFMEVVPEEVTQE